MFECLRNVIHGGNDKVDLERRMTEATIKRINEIDSRIPKVDVEEFYKFSAIYSMLNPQTSYKDIIEAYHKAKEEDKVGPFIEEHTH